MLPLLLETDQTCCYDAKGRGIPCHDARQDASVPKKRPLGGYRFTVQGEVVFDNVTGAVWTRNANPAEFPLTFAESLAFTQSMAEENAYGYSGWRLPTRRALFSLVGHQEIRPALPKDHPFQHVFSGYYWTADTVRRFPDQAWRIDFGGGRAPRAHKTDASLVWPVCLPEYPVLVPAESRFFIEGDCVRDAATGLVWAVNADLAQKPLTWEQSLHMTATLNDRAFGGVREWRLPNIRELESLVDITQDSPALPQGYPFMNVRDFYWSSTTSAYEARYAWALYFRDGFVGVGFKADPEFFFWPVWNKKEKYPVNAPG